jgi:hypothetical protein
MASSTAFVLSPPLQAASARTGSNAAETVARGTPIFVVVETPTSISQITAV